MLARSDVVSANHGKALSRQKHSLCQHDSRASDLSDCRPSFRRDARRSSYEFCGFRPNLIDFHIGFIPKSSDNPSSSANLRFSAAAAALAAASSRAISAADLTVLPFLFRLLDARACLSSMGVGRCTGRRRRILYDSSFFGKPIAVIFGQFPKVPLPMLWMSGGRTATSFVN